MTKRIAALALAAGLAYSCAAFAQDRERQEPGPAPIEMGRQFGALPWIADLPDMPFVVVDFSGIPILADFPRATECYEIDPAVVAQGFTYYFYVRGRDRDFVVGSTPNLAKLCRELAALEELKRRNKGKEFVEGAGDSIVGIGKGMGRLVAHPGVSMKDFGHRMRRLGRSAERAVGADPKVGRSESGVDRSRLGGGPAGKERRELAYELGVDVYTDNPLLRDALVAFSQVKKAGGLTTWIIPYHLGMFDNFNPIAGDGRTELLIRDNDPYELRRTVGKHLEPLLGQSREGGASPLSRLLLNPNYTPRQIAYVGKDLVDMGQAADLRLPLEILAEADTPEMADMFALQLRLYSFLHRRIQPVARFTPFQRLFAAIGTDGAFYFMFTGDTVRPWEFTSRSFDDMVREAVALGARGMEIWTMGDVDAGMARNAAALGVVVRPDILRDPQFFPAPEQNAK